jgi:hypothetical protein
VTALVREKVGELAVVTEAIARENGTIIALGMFCGEESTNRIVTLKVEGLSAERVRALIEPFVVGITDIRTCC